MCGRAVAPPRVAPGRRRSGLRSGRCDLGRGRRLDGVAALDLFGLARVGADVAGGRAHEAAGLLLLEDVRAPAGGTRTREHRGEHVRRDLGEVEDDRRPELDVGLDRPVGTPLAQLLQRGLLQRQRGLEAGRAELLGGAAQHAGARVLGAVDAVAEAHEPLAAVEQVLHVRLGVAALLDAVEHVQHAGGGAAVQRAGHRADGAGERGGDVGAGGGDDAGGEGGGVHAVLGGRRPVGVDGGDVRGSGSPRQRTMNRSTIVAASSTPLCGTAGMPMPRADWAT